METRIIRRPKVCRLTGLSNSTLERLERAGEFPSRRQLGPNSVGWVRAEIEDWLATRPAVNNSPQGDAS